MHNVFNQERFWVSILSRMSDIRRMYHSTSFLQHLLRVPTYSSYKIVGHQLRKYI